MNPEQFQQALADHGIALSVTQMEQFADYYHLLVQTNEHVNLTRITEKKEVYLKHFYDSITGVFAEPRLQNETLTLCDIGAGAGFRRVQQGYERHSLGSRKQRSECFNKRYRR